MNNPFEIIDVRLRNIESLLLDIKHGNTAFNNYKDNRETNMDIFLNVHKNEISTRLRNVLLNDSSLNVSRQGRPIFEDVHGIMKHQFLKYRLAGEGCWNEFVKLRGY